MKRFIEKVGKLGKMLPALLFMITCGTFVVYAVMGSGGKFYTEYNVGTLGNTVTSDKWNSIMNDLDEIIPEGTVIALLTGECPEGWNEFTGAEGRFLIGANSGIGGTGGSNILTEVPAHQHELKYRNREKGTDESNDTNNNTLGLIVDWDDGYMPIGVSLPGTSWIGTSYTIKTSPEGETSVDITNKFVKVRYCVKG